MKIFKRILLVLAILASMALGALVFYAAIHHDPSSTGSGGGDDKYMYLNDVRMGLTVRNNGDLIVTEQLTYDLGSKAWKGLYQDIILNNDEKVEDVRVYKGTVETATPLPSGSGIELGKGGDYGTFGYGVVKDPSRRLRVVWNVNDTGGQSYVIRYRLTNAVRNYRDASYLIWDVWGTGWETGVGRLDSFTEFPGKVNDFYVRTDELQYRIDGVSTAGATATFKAHDLPAGRYVQIRALAEPLTGTKAEPFDITPEFKADEAAYKTLVAKRAKQSAELRNRNFLYFFIFTLIGGAIGLLIVLLCGRTIGRDGTKFTPAGGSYQYPPEPIPAPVIGKALGGSETENLVSATLLALLQKDVFRVLPSIHKKEDIGIMNNVGEQTYDKSKVTPWEAPIADLLQHAIDDHEEHAPDFTKLKKHLTPSYAETKIDAFNKALDAQLPHFNLEKTYRGYLRRALIGTVASILYVVALIAIMGSGGNSAAARWDASWVALPFIGFASVLGWAAVDGHAFYRLRPDQAERVRKWETYKDFFAKMDMSREYPMTVEIWDEALIYAASFGYAKKVITNMPRPQTESGVGSSGLSTIATSGFAASALGSMTSGMGSVTGMSTSSSSGGGGGGGSGGGGGGGW